MATPNEKLASSLAKLKKLQKDGRRVFRSSSLTRVHRERLVKNGFLREVMKGWLISSSPAADSSDTTPWYASFWEFCAGYCSERFGRPMASFAGTIAPAPRRRTRSSRRRS